MRPEPSGVILALSSAGDTDGLTGEASTDEVNGLEVRSAFGFDVAIAFYVGPVLCEHLTAKFVYLNLPAAFHPGAFQSEIEAADAGE
jgi:hypothetical protein